MRPPVWQIAVFAYNEGEHIIACLDSIKRCRDASCDVRAYVLANGCRDNTEAVVARYAEDNPWVTLVPIQKGDKANAWNTFVHDFADTNSTAFFVCLLYTSPSPRDS